MNPTEIIIQNQLVTGFILGGIYIYALIKLLESYNNIQESFNGSIKEETRSDKRIRMTLK